MGIMQIYTTVEIYRNILTPSGGENYIPKLKVGAFLNNNSGIILDRWPIYLIVESRILQAEAGDRLIKCHAIICAVLVNCVVKYIVHGTMCTILYVYPLPCYNIYWKCRKGTPSASIN
jgi:hypothetical protein